MADNEVRNIDSVISYNIYKVARYSPLTYDELYQIAYLGYLKAQKNYNPIYGKMSASYANISIQQELIATLKKEYKLINNTVADCPEEIMEYIASTRAEAIEDNPTTAPILAKIQKLMSKLPDKQKYVLDSYYFARHPKRLVDLAKEMGVSKQRIHELKTTAIKNIKQLLSAEDK